MSEMSVPAPSATGRMKSGERTDTYRHETLGSLRVCEDELGEPWFVARDVLSMLGTPGNTSQCMRFLLDNEKRHMSVAVNGVMQEMNVVSEVGLCVMAIRSKSRDRETLQRWVANEIMPRYRNLATMRPMTADEMLGDPDVMIAILEAYKRERERNAPLEHAAPLATMTVSAVRDGNGIRLEVS